MKSVTFQKKKQALRVSVIRIEYYAGTQHTLNYVRSVMGMVMSGTGMVQVSVITVPMAGSFLTTGSRNNQKTCNLNQDVYVMVIAGTDRMAKKRRQVKSGSVLTSRTDRQVAQRDGRNQ